MNYHLKGSKAIKYVEKTLGYPLETLLLFPKFFLIETINVCNTRCIMCGIDFDKKKKAAMTDNLFDKITNEITQYSNHVEKVILYLDGEPLLDRKLPSRIRKLKEGGIKKINIASNASLLDCAKARQIIDAGLDEIYITLDSLKKDVFETVRPRLKFETVYKNIIDFVKLRNQLNPKLTIRIQMILQKLNYHEVDSFSHHWVPRLNPNDQVIVQKAHNWGSTVEVMEFGDEDTINYVPCIALWGTLCIHVDGQVGLCCMDTKSTLPLGKVTSQTIAEIWSGKPLRTIREKHIEGCRYQISLCNKCTVWRETKHEREKVLKTA
ncbi:MAG: SPASM domain-containing protein [Candidatus Omnitrophota bacterium]|nr:MAG: SPASM domain-containing protein [Candidatus Omnitrophota bacterium]